MGTIAFAQYCVLDKYNSISFDFWDASVRIEDFEKKLLKLRTEYENCKLKQRENNLNKKLKEIQEDFE